MRVTSRSLHGCIDLSVHTLGRIDNVNKRHAAVPSDEAGTEKSIAAGTMEFTRKFIELVMQKLPVGIMVSDEKGTIVSFNATAQRILSCGPVEVSSDDLTRANGCYLADTVTPFPADRLPLACALRGEVVTDVEVFVRNEHASSGVWISASAAPWRDEDGGASGAVVVLRDITSQKRSLEEIVRLSSAVEQTADAVIITDMKGTITYVNAGFEGLTGYSREEAVGQTPRLLKSGEHERRFYQDLWKTVLDGRVFHGTVINRKKSGQLFHAAQTISPVRGSDGHHAFFVSVQKDITDRLQHEQLKVEMNVARQVQQRLYPIHMPQLPGFDIAGAAFPAATMCGDLFDFFPMDGDCLGLAVADVCGHGIGPSLLMAQARAYIRSLALSCSNLGELLRQLNEILTVDSNVRNYLTLLLVRLDPRTRTLAYASAGHMTGYLLDGGGEIREHLESTGIPLGMFAERSFLSGPKLSLEPGEMVILFTDGITEAGELDGNAFGTDKLLEFIKDHRSDRASNIVEGLCRTAQSFEVKRSQRDDMTAIICKIEAAP